MNTTKKFIILNYLLAFNQNNIKSNFVLKIVSCADEVF